MLCHSFRVWSFSNEVTSECGRSELALWVGSDPVHLPFSEVHGGGSGRGPAYLLWREHCGYRQQSICCAMRWWQLSCSVSVLIGACVRRQGGEVRAILQRSSGEWVEVLPTSRARMAWLEVARRCRPCKDLQSRNDRSKYVSWVDPVLENGQFDRNIEYRKEKCQWKSLVPTFG